MSIESLTRAKLPFAYFYPLGTKRGDMAQPSKCAYQFPNRVEANRFCEQQNLSKRLVRSAAVRCKCQRIDGQPEHFDKVYRVTVKL